ncbi:MAG: hypothetical protein ACRCXZ_01415 [Patescibacteria group bacterium]
MKPQSLLTNSTIFVTINRSTTGAKAMNISELIPNWRKHVKEFQKKQKPYNKPFLSVSKKVFVFESNGVTISKEFWLLKYTHFASLDGIWFKHPDQEVRDLFNLSRGIIIDEEGTIFGRPMDKFHDAKGLSEETRTNSNANLKVIEKIDGHLGTYFCYLGKWIFASSGALESPTIDVAWSIIEDNKADFENLDPQLTYNFEVVHPATRIVVQYKEPKLVLISVRNTATGDFVDLDGIDYPHKPEDLSKSQVFTSIEEVQQYANSLTNHEGFVVTTPDGVMHKVKGEWYSSLKKQMKGLDSSKIADAIISRKTKEECVNEFHEALQPWVAKTWDALLDSHARLLYNSIWLVELIKTITEKLVEKSSFSYDSFELELQEKFPSIQPNEYKTLVEGIWFSIETSRLLYADALAKEGESIGEFRFGTGRSLEIWKNLQSKDSEQRSYLNFLQLLAKDDLVNAKVGIWNTIKKTKVTQPEFL